MTTPLWWPTCPHCQAALTGVEDLGADPDSLAAFEEVLLALYQDAPEATPVTELYARYLVGYHERGHSEDGYDPFEGLC